MYKYIFLLSALTVCCISYELESLTGTPMEQCINCICYATTGTWDTYLCGHELLTNAYWRTAGSLSTSSARRPKIARKMCRKDVNCILNTIKRYTEQFGLQDLNSDGKFNCQDRFGIQTRGNVNRETDLAYFDRFYSCLPNVIKSEEEVGGNQTVVGGNNQNGGGRYQNGGGRYQNGGVNNQNRGGSNRNGGENNQNGRRNNQNRAQVNQDIAVLVQQNVNGNNKVEQNVGLITGQTTRGNALREGNNQNRDGNNQNRGGNDQNVVRNEFQFQQTVIGSNNNVGQNVAVVASQTSGGNAKQGVEVLVHQNDYNIN